ncbi:hypothetical protein NDU88_001624 [Pleurodeles waltl]|uniref:Uncharacterized protein n=1 Tax=Pleurodeles waltl TaxID=8319 RepID=A0AAV7RD55_PLEWA|nr:hypothetical protein NDU88_001624 [Pleurodeles waltl]
MKRDRVGCFPHWDVVEAGLVALYLLVQHGSGLAAALSTAVQYGTRRVMGLFSGVFALVTDDAETPTTTAWPRQVSHRLV